MHKAEPTRKLDKAYIQLDEKDMERIARYKGARAEYIHSIRYIRVNQKYDAHLYVSCSGKIRVAVIVRDFPAAGCKEKIYEINLDEEEAGLCYLQDEGNNFMLYILKPGGTYEDE